MPWWPYTATTRKFVDSDSMGRVLELVLELVMGRWAALGRLISQPQYWNSVEVLCREVVQSSRGNSMGSSVAGSKGSDRDTGRELVRLPAKPRL